jgi:hypothetical protein
MYINNAKERLFSLMQKYKEPNWSPPNEDLFIFSVLTTILRTYDPIGILNALNYNFSIDDICDEYDTEAAAIMRCNDQWHDASRLGHVIKKLLDHYFADNYPFNDYLFLAEHAISAINDKRIPLDLNEIKKVSRKHEWIPIQIG